MILGLYTFILVIYCVKREYILHGSVCYTHPITCTHIFELVSWVKNIILALKLCLKLTILVQKRVCNNFYYFPHFYQAPIY